MYIIIYKRQTTEKNREEHIPVPDAMRNKTFKQGNNYEAFTILCLYVGSDIQFLSLRWYKVVFLKIIYNNKQFFFS